MYSVHVQEIFLAYQEQGQHSFTGSDKRRSWCKIVSQNLLFALLQLCMPMFHTGSPNAD